MDTDTLQRPSYNIVCCKIDTFTKWIHGGSKLALTWGFEKESTEVMALGMQLRR